MSLKQKLLHLLEKSMETEENLIPIYANHCTFFSGCLDINPDVRKKLVDTFLELRDKSREHKDNLESFLKNIKDRS